MGLDEVRMDPESVERRLAAILSADVVGYSRLMAEDEADIVAGHPTDALEAARRLLALRSDYFRGHLYLAMSFAALDRPDEAHKAMAEAIRLQPDLSVALVRRSLAFTEPDVMDRFLSPLRKLGLKG